MSVYVYEDKRCTFCKKRILLSQPLFMGNCMTFCSPICRKNKLMEKLSS